jgi:hypothetical protein
MAADYSGPGSYCRSRSSVGSREGLGRAGIAGLGGLAQGLGRGVQQPVGEGIGQVFDDLVGGFARR